MWCYSLGPVARLFRIALSGLDRASVLDAASAAEPPVSRRPWAGNKTSRGHAHGRQPDCHRSNRQQPNGDGPDRCQPDGHRADGDQPQRNPTDAERPDDDPAHGHQADSDVTQVNDPAGASQPIAAICLPDPTAMRTTGSCPQTCLER